MKKKTSKKKKIIYFIYRLIKSNYFKILFFLVKIIAFVYQIHIKD